MNEKRPFCGESGQETSSLPYDELPLNFQSLGAICEEAGVFGEYELILRNNPDRDYRHVYNDTVQLLAEHTDLSREVILKGLQGEGVDIHEEEAVEPVHRRWYD